MTSNKPTLLTLPREMRNEIYKYLYKASYCKGDIVFEVHDFCGQPDGSTFGVEIYNENAPLSSVLLVNRQVWAEYTESNCFSDCRATVNCGVMCGTLQTKDRKAVARCVSALARVRHVTLLMYEHAVVHRSTQIKAVVGKFPHVASLRLILETQSISQKPRKDLDALLHTSLAIGLPRKYINMPKTIENMYLIQHGHGYYVSRLYQHPWGIPVPRDAWYDYEVTGLQALLYACDDAKPIHRRLEIVSGDLLKLTSGLGEDCRDMGKLPDEEIGVIEWVDLPCDMDDVTP